MSEETVVVICPNPKCRREIQEPVLLSILSATPPKTYQACPYCFTDLTSEPSIEEDIVPEPTVEDKESLDEIEEPETATNSEPSVQERDKSGSGFFNKVRSLIPLSNSSQKEVEEPQTETVPIEEELVTKEELTPEPLVVEESEESLEGEPLVNEEPIKPEEPEEALKTKELETKEEESSGCPDEFGYLANRPPDTPIPSQCLVCPKMVDCMLSPKDE